MKYFLGILSLVLVVLCANSSYAFATYTYSGSSKKDSYLCDIDPIAGDSLDSSGWFRVQIYRGATHSTDEKVYFFCENGTVVLSGIVYTCRAVGFSPRGKPNFRMIKWGYGGPPKGICDGFVDWIKREKYFDD